jgi:hypothetical protein
MIKKHCLLTELFDQIDSLVYNDILLSDIEYVGVGQLCVAKEYRGTNIYVCVYIYILLLWLILLHMLICIYRIWGCGSALCCKGI